MLQPLCRIAFSICTTIRTIGMQLGRLLPLFAKAFKPAIYGHSIRLRFERATGLARLLPDALRTARAPKKTPVTAAV